LTFLVLVPALVVLTDAADTSFLIGIGSRERLEDLEMQSVKMTTHDLTRAVEENSVTRIGGLLTWAAENGHLTIVERLLLDERVDPSDWRNYAVRWAARNGHLAVVERLLLDPRVDPSANNSEAVRWTALNGHLAIVERLLLDSRVDPSDNDNEAVRLAALNGCLVVVERLLCDARTKLTAKVSPEPIALRAMQLYAPKIAAVLSRLGLTIEASSSVLKQVLRLTGLEKKRIEELMWV
jgi:Ankyrin repeats (3 copies)